MGHDQHLVGGWPTPLKNLSSSVGMKHKKMFQISNQYIYPSIYPSIYLYIYLI